MAELLDSSKKSEKKETKQRQTDRSTYLSVSYLNFSSCHSVCVCLISPPTVSVDCWANLPNVRKWKLGIILA